MKGRKWTAWILAALMLFGAAAADGGAQMLGSGYPAVNLQGIRPVSWETQEEYENPDRMLDGNVNTVYEHTCWDSHSLDDIPEVTFFFNGVTLQEIWIRNGNQAGETAYYDHARIKLLYVTVVMTDGLKATYRYQLEDAYRPDDVADGWYYGYQRVSLPQIFWNVARVEFGIPGWYKGETERNVINVTDIAFLSDSDFGASVTTPAPVQPVQPAQPEIGGYTASGKVVVLNDRMATRSGPGTQYTELGSYFQAGTAVTAVSAAYDERNEIWWIQTEFSYNGEMRRAYTGVKRLDMQAGDVPAEYQLADEAVLNRSVYAYYGPGYGYTMYNRQIPAGTEGKIWRSEGEYAQFEFYDEAEGAWRRVWVPESALEAYNG